MEAEIIVTHALTRCGQLISPCVYSSILEQSPLHNKSVTTLCVNRPEALHALNAAMCETLYARIHQLRLSETRCVILKSTSPSRAFCAGGDIRRLCVLAEKREYDLIAEFFKSEYRLNSLLGCIQTPDIVSILDGIVMGGGLGLSVHGRFRVATENTVFAMPEAAIGFHPDVGASHFLSRLIPGLGLYITLTGAQLRGKQVLHAGIATHYVPQKSIFSLLESFHETRIRSKDDIESLLRRFCKTEVPSTENAWLFSTVKELFGLPSVEDIVHKLRETSLEADSRHGTFATNCLQAIQRQSPMSLKISFESLKRGSRMELDGCIKMEFRLSIRLTRDERTS
ncbi:3-hydroxyisobutyryl-CoA hydrolase [Gracilaria domingensis]|nr:3-hydroxyisobutyryl-CoA hydrolase [Gracilaria domingensis]